MGESKLDEATARCPSCGKYLSYKQLTFGAEHHVIRCKRCGERLMKRTYLMPILVVGGLAGLVAVRFIDGGSRYSFWHLAWLATLAVVGLLTAKVRIAKDDDPNPAAEEVRTGPPPPETHFRGSKGPPPKRGD